MKTSNDKFYLIQHLPSGTFKAEGQNGKFSRFGKIWRGGRVKAFLRQFRNYGYRRPEELTLMEKIQEQWGDASIHNCEIIECELRPIRRKNLADFIREDMEAD